jgi:hypothetical protein
MLREPHIQVYPCVSTEIQGADANMALRSEVMLANTSAPQANVIGRAVS